MTQRLVSNFQQSVVQQRELQAKTKLVFQQKHLLNGEQFLGAEELAQLVARFEPGPDGRDEFFLSFLTLLFLELATCDCPVDSLELSLVRWLLRAGRVATLQAMPSRMQLGG